MCHGARFVRCDAIIWTDWDYAIVPIRVRTFMHMHMRIVHGCVMWWGDRVRVYCQASGDARMAIDFTPRDCRPLARN